MADIGADWRREIRELIEALGDGAPEWPFVEAVLEEVGSKVRERKEVAPGEVEGVIGLTLITFLAYATIGHHQERRAERSRRQGVLPGMFGLHAEAAEQIRDTPLWLAGAPLLRASMRRHLALLQGTELADGTSALLDRADALAAEGKGKPFDLRVLLPDRWMRSPES